MVLGREASAADARGAAAAAIEGQAVFIHKREFSVFEGNPGAAAFVEALAAGLARRFGAPPLFVVCGVAADVCVRQAVDGRLARGQRVAVVRDATWGLGLERVEVLLAGWEAAGARVVGSEAMDGLARG